MATIPSNYSKLRKFLAEQHQKQTKIAKIFYSALFIVIIYSLMYYTGDPLGILKLFGINSVHVQEKGLYVNCSLAKNKNHPYCKRPKRKSEAEQNWNHIKRNGKNAPVFNLYNYNK